MDSWISKTPLIVLVMCFMFYGKPFMILQKVSGDSIENWPWLETKAARLEQVLAGKQIILRCAGRVLNATAHWDYKPCGNRPRISCLEVISNEREGTLTDDWIPLHSNRNTIILKNVQHSSSGLYRCREAASALINVYSTIELEVINYREEQDGSLPQFLDGLPKNCTATVDSQVVFQCKVSSRSPPTIVWLLQGAGPLRYRGQSYLPINSTGEMKLSDNVYLSKMVIHDVRPKHAGVYYCLAFNTKGFANTTMLLRVIGTSDIVLDLERIQGTSLYFLFLIPVALALMPLSIWLCFLCLRKNVYSANCNSKREECSGSTDVTYSFERRKRFRHFRQIPGQDNITA